MNISIIPKDVANKSLAFHHVNDALDKPLLEEFLRFSSKMKLETLGSRSHRNTGILSKTNRISVSKPRDN